MTDYTHIEEQIANLTPYQPIQEMPASVLNEAIQTMTDMLAVVEAADEAARWVHPDAPGYIDEDLRIALAKLKP